MNYCEQIKVCKYNKSLYNMTTAVSMDTPACMYCRLSIDTIPGGAFFEVLQDKLLNKEVVLLSIKYVVLQTEASLIIQLFVKLWICYQVSPLLVSTILLPPLTKKGGMKAGESERSLSLSLPFIHIHDSLISPRWRECEAYKYGTNLMSGSSYKWISSQIICIVAGINCDLPSQVQPTSHILWSESC